MGTATARQARPAPGTDGVARAPVRGVTAPVLQRKCACGGRAGLSGECSECQAEGSGSLQRRSAGPSRPAVLPRSVHDVLGTPGDPLEPATRAFMEARFGHDFSRVRIHTDARAADSARAVNALAFAVGKDVVFGSGQYAPATTAGKRLLAHELAHVVQQQTDIARLQRQKAEGGESAPKLTITGVVAAGDELSSSTIEQVNEAAKKVPSEWRRFVAYETVVKVGGSLAWRANNPGNLRSAPTQIAKVPGASGAFAVFATMDEGRAAQKELYLSKYGDQTVRVAVGKLTPPSENDTPTYLKELEEAGVALDSTMKSQITTLMPAIQANEGMIDGILVPRQSLVKPLSGPAFFWGGEIQEPISPPVQRKSMAVGISRPGDPLEVEADRVADQVMGRAWPVGPPLDPGPLASTEPRFGHDFGRMLVHTDLAAAELSPAGPMLQRECVAGAYWKFEYDGCSVWAGLANALSISDVNNPAGGKNTEFSNAAHAGACDRHDECYQTCHTYTPHAREACDRKFRRDMEKACDRAESPEIKKKCLAAAHNYYLGVRTGGLFFYHQQRVCKCVGLGDFPEPPTGEVRG